MMHHKELSLPFITSTTEEKIKLSKNNNVSSWCSIIVFMFLLVVHEQVDAALDQGVAAVRTVVLEGFGSRISRFNIGQKYKYHKV